MGLFGIFKKGNNSGHAAIAAQYKKFCDRNQLQPLVFYGLIPFGRKGSPAFHTKPYEKTLAAGFQFGQPTMKEHAYPAWMGKWKP